MTREEKIQQMLDDWVSVKICEKAMIDDINEIYDDFESRTCENCKFGYLEEDYLILCNEDFYDNKIYDTADNLLSNALFYPDKDFGCNKFERKEL